MENYTIQRNYYPESELIENYVYVSRKIQSKHLILEAKEKLPKYDFVGIKAVGAQVVRAIQLVEDLAKELPNLKRVNIPGIVEV